MEQPLRIGIIGCGHVSEAHLEEMEKDPARFAVVAVADAAPGAARARAAQFRIPRWYAGAGEILADPAVEAVFVLTPPSTHAELTLAALEAGKHVFCEKPLARTSAQCRAILEAVGRSGRVFNLGYPLRHSRDAINLRQVIQSGRLGRPVFFRDVWALCKGSPSPAIHDAELGGGVLYEHTHWLDLIGSIFGPPSKVYASMRRLKPGGFTADDTLVAIFDFPTGDQAVWSESWAAPGLGWEPLCVARHVRPTLDVIGPRGSLHFPGAEGQQRLNLYEHAAGMARPTEQWEWENDWGTSEVAFPNEHRHFYECIRHGAQPVCTAADGLAAILLAEAVAESSRTGMPVWL